MSSTLRYKFVELSTVTDDALEGVVNEWVARGWELDGIRFVPSEASKRPAMAFISFTREEPALDANERQKTEPDQ